MAAGSDRAARWAHVQRIFHEALEHGGLEREDYLDQTCGDDAPLREEVVSLLASAESGFIGEPRDRPEPLELEDSRIGPFRILRPLGHGGMGSVYLAEREGAGFTQQVALQLLRAAVLLPARLAPQLESGADRASLDLARTSSRIEVEQATRERERLEALVAAGAVPERRLIDARHSEAEARAALVASQRRRHGC